MTTTTEAAAPTPVRAALYILAWASILFLIGGGPTVLYVMTYSLPSDNTLSEFVPEFAQSAFELVLSGGLAFYLSVFSSFVLPAVTNFTVRRLRQEKSGQHRLQTGMAIVARTLLVVVVPCVAVLVFNDGCFRGWMQLWVPCREKGYFDQSVSVPYFQYFARVPSYGSIDLSLVTHEAICNPGYQSGTCARSMLSVLGPVLLKKMMYAPLFSALEVLLWHAKRRYNRGGFNPHRRTQLPSWWVDARGRSNTAAAAEDESSPDPMRRLVWFETALVFGGLVPLLLPLLALQLHTDARVFGWALRKRSGSDDANGSTATAATKPVLRWAMLVHAVLVLFMHSLLVAFFFLDSGVHGAAGLIATLAVIWMAFVMSMCWRISMWDLLRCRWRLQRREQIGGVDGALFHNPLLGHMRDNQMLQERRGFVAVLCVLAVAGIYTAGLAVWGLFALCGWA